MKAASEVPLSERPTRQHRRVPKCCEPSATGRPRHSLGGHQKSDPCGREIGQSDTIPDWATKELMDTIQKKGKGQQDVIVGAMYRGACTHTAFKAGGNEMAQLSVADKGVATTSEKYTIAHSNHVGLKYIALKWQNLPMMVNDGESSSEDITYRGIHDRTKETHSGQRNERHT